jgi:ArsR family transcriptional regulator, zinc-responsive transcriptional repressor
MNRSLNKVGVTIPAPVSDSKKKSARAVTSELIKALDSKFFKALSDPTRVEILKQLLLLQRGDVSAIAANTKVHRSVVSRHLAIMHDAGIVDREKIGRNMFYQLNALEFLRRIGELNQSARSLAETCCPWACKGEE